MLEDAAQILGGSALAGDQRSRDIALQMAQRGQRKRTVQSPAGSGGRTGAPVWCGFGACVIELKGTRGEEEETIKGRDGE